MDHRRGVYLLLILALACTPAVLFILVVSPEHCELRRLPLVLLPAVLFALVSVTTGAIWRLGFRRVGCAALFFAIAPLALSLVLVPNLVGAIDRGRQKTTMRKMLAIGAWIETQRTPTGHYPTWRQTRLAKIAKPDNDELPRLDGWCNEFEISSRPDRYLIISLGKDVACELPEIGEYPFGKTQDFDADIVYSNGAFLRWPEGQPTDPDALLGQD